MSHADHLYMFFNLQCITHYKWHVNPSSGANGLYVNGPLYYKWMEGYLQGIAR